MYEHVINKLAKHLHLECYQLLESKILSLKDHLPLKTPP